MPTVHVASAPRGGGRGDTAGALPARYEAIDAARGLAVLGMIGVHLAGTEGGATAVERALAGALAAVEPTVAALFCVAAGMSWSIQAGRFGTTPRFRRYLAGRALALGVFGVLFHVLLWPTEILVPFALMMALSLLVLGQGWRVAAAAAGLFVAIAPAVTFLLGDHAATDWLDNGLHAADRTVGWVTVRYLLFDGNYPLVSWLAFPLIGMVLWPGVAAGRSTLRRWTAGALCTAVLAQILGARAAAAADSAAASHLAISWTPTSMTFLLSTGGWAVATIAVLLWWRGTGPMPRPFLPLVLIGRASLSHYVLHIAIAYSALRLWYPEEDWPVSVGTWTMLVYLVVGLPLTLLWFRHHAQGPFEALWARASRRPAPRPAPGAAEGPAHVALSQST